MVAITLILVGLVVFIGWFHYTLSERMDKFERSIRESRIYEGRRLELLVDRVSSFDALIEDLEKAIEHNRQSISLKADSRRKRRLELGV